MESLSKAEMALKDLQEKLNKKDAQIDKTKLKVGLDQCSIIIFKQNTENVPLAISYVGSLLESWKADVNNKLLIKTYCSRTVGFSFRGL